MTAQWARPAAPFVAAAGFALFLLGTVWFLAFHVGAGGQADQSVFRGFAGLHRWHPAYRVATFEARLFDPRPYAGLALLPLAIALVRGQFRLAAAVLVLLVGASVTTHLVKEVVSVPRSSSVPGGVVPTATSWPSGHSTAAMALALSWVMVVPERARPAVAGVVAACAVALGYALMTLRWHYASDVEGGFLVAAVWTLLSLAALRSLDCTRGASRRAVRPGSEEFGETGLRMRPALIAAAPALLALAALLAVAHSHVLAYTDTVAPFLAGAALVASLGLGLVSGVTALMGLSFDPHSGLGRDITNGKARGGIDSGKISLRSGLKMPASRTANSPCDHSSDT